MAFSIPLNTRAAREDWSADNRNVSPEVRMSVLRFLRLSNDPGVLDKALNYFLVLLELGTRLNPTEVDAILRMGAENSSLLVREKARLIVRKAAEKGAVLSAVQKKIFDQSEAASIPGRVSATLKQGGNMLTMLPGLSQLFRRA